MFSVPLVPCVEPSPCRPRPGPLRDADLDLDVNLDVDLDMGLDSAWRIWDGLCDFGRENGGMVGSGVWLRVLGMDRKTMAPRGPPHRRTRPAPPSSNSHVVTVDAPNNQ